MKTYTVELISQIWEFDHSIDILNTTGLLMNFLKLKLFHVANFLQGTFDLYGLKQSNWTTVNAAPSKKLKTREILPVNPLVEIFFAIPHWLPTKIMD
jgi:hypothetical protein